MRKWLAGSVVAAGLLMLSAGAMAASPGAPLPSGASEVEVFKWDAATSNWVSLGATGQDNVDARSWNSHSMNSGGLQNKKHYAFSFTNHASVAQWIDWHISGTRKDWRIRRPGVYAADSITFSILSNNDVNVKFDNFADLEYENLALAPPGTETTIETWYGYGGTIQNVEANGWISAADLNDADFTFANSLALHDGLTYKVWSKIQVENSNNSSDYEDVGDITLCLTNIKHWIDPVTGNFTNPQL